MSESVLGLYWGARQQSLDECANLCFQTIIALREAGFDGFFQRGQSREDALRRPLDVSVEAIGTLLGDGVNRREDNHLHFLGDSMSLARRNARR